jgi:signal transduction histidine kinase/CheY-like chemotaxis protein/HPt (histidine-containing phosphotransfer) domain-containing protein
VKLADILRANKKQLIFVFMAFLLLVLASCFSMSYIVEKQLVTNAREVLTSAEATINLNLREMEVALLATALTLQNSLWNGGTHEQLKGYMLELTDWLMQPVNGFSSFISVYGFFDGEFFDGSGWIPPSDYVPQERPWYLAAQSADYREVAFAAPYIDVRTGMTIISVSIALRSYTGEFYGVVAIDFDVSKVSKYITSLQFADGGYGMLADNNMNLIAHPDDAYRGLPFADLSAEHAAITERLRLGEREVLATSLRNFQGARVITFFMRMKNGWHVGIATPEWSYYKEVYLMTSILSILGFIFMSMLSYFLIQLSIEKMRSDEENKSKSSFLARMSHEIRTPMNSILGMSELIMRKNISQEVQEYISIVHQAGNSLLSIINDILDFSKIESGQLKIDSRNYFLASLMNDLISVIRARLVDKQLDFFVNADSNIPGHLMGDDIRLRQIVVNLLSNAVKYTPNGFISLDIQYRTVGDDKVELIIRVSDSGVGIKKEDIGKLFVDFSRLDVEYNRRVEGSGLGLAIARTFCKLMGGNVTVTSEYGKGSTFTATVIQSYVGDDKLAVVKDPGQKRVLLYEERILHRQSAIRAMNGLGVTPDCAANLDEFKEDMKDGDYDFAFVSSNYGMDCINVLSECHTPVQLVVMVELGDASAFSGVGSILLPLHSVSVANALNYIFETGAGTAIGGLARFTIPGAKVLIVDDISSNLRVAKELVSQFKASVETCDNGAKAVELVKKNRYDMVFMDHMMPEMDGVEATSIIRGLGGEGDDYYKKLPIVALTANALPGHREMFLENGMDDFLAKPIETRRLESVLKKWIPAEKHVESMPTQGDSAPIPAPAFVIPDVDVLWGFRNIGGSVDLYRDILMGFCSDANEKILQISKTIEDGDYKLYRIYVHAIKGAARSIGDGNLADSAASLEEAARDGNRDVIDEKTGDLLKSLSVMVANINTALNSDGGDSEAPGAARPDLQLAVLKSALMGMDIATVNEMLIKYVSMKLDQETKDMISEIEQHILMFEYDKAIEKIDRIL